MKKNALHHMTWKEAEETFQEDPVVIVPLGSMEEHGPHSIMGDFLAATALAERVAKQTNSLYIPTIPFGNSEYFRGYPGTISFSQQTVIQILFDIIKSLVEHDITKIVIFNGHSGNASAISEVARAVRREDKIMITSMDLWQMIPCDQKKEVYQGETNDPSGHGGEPLTSVMLHLFPEKMRMDLLPETWYRREKWGEFPIDNLSKVKVNDSKGNLFFNMEELSPEGILGNPTNSSKERGELIVTSIIEYGISLVDSLKSSDMTLK